MSRFSDSRGFTLVEVLIVSALFLVVLTATVTSLASFERLNRDNQRVDDQTERVRRTVDRASRQLRNLATRPTTTAATTIAEADKFDFVFQTSDPSRTWVRYCTETVATGRARLWSLANKDAVSAPASTQCPGLPADWPTAQRDVVAENITNQAVSGREIPMFAYGRDCTTSSSPTCATDLGSITSVNIDVLLDDDLTRKPAETRVTSGVFLRNQNERPTAMYTWRASTKPREVILNASSSTDPEERTLKYYWYRDTRPAGWSCADPDGTANVTYHTGVTLTYTFPATDAASGTYTNFELMVCDPGDLWDDFKTPSPGVLIP